MSDRNEMKMAHDELVRILRAAGYRILDSDATHAVVKRGNRTVIVPSVEGMDDERFSELLDSLGMSRGTLDALCDVSAPPSSRGSRMR
jgi:hypothetical protein